ncbi:NYN domain-containing protein [Rhizophagus clarus]|uniref:NYN domain-containing protein n=1 Tax=Rhizophagus clarus TaxID=94130 RepID=A0A8H3QMQ3_9GLOM|nr:NYN domain-containing protein [Rhizophagus clarus]
MSYILNCFVLGEDPFEKNFQFYLDTSKIQTIGLLKNAIIASQKLNVAAKEVKLWRVNFPLTGINEEQKLDFINKCTNVNINIRDELDGVELPTISMSNNEFVTQQNLQHAHVIVQLSSAQPVSDFSKEPTGLVHVFIDNSNVEIEGKKLISKLEKIYENQLHIDYGRLLKTVLNGRQIGDDPIFVGSRPPPNDSIWRELTSLGCRVTVFDRNAVNQEKEVDNELGASISDAIQEYKRPGIIALVAGDGDYRPELRRALLRGWSVEIWFWDHAMSQRLKWINVPYRPDLQTTIMYLDSYYIRFIYACGRDNSRRKKYLEINGDAVGTWGNEHVMEFYVNSNTFCWWDKANSHSFYMYFENLEQWKEAKCWVKKIYPEVQELPKEIPSNLSN